MSVCRFLGLMAVFVCGALLSFVLTVVVLRKENPSKPKKKSGYELVSENQKTEDKAEKELKT